MHVCVYVCVFTHIALPQPFDPCGLIKKAPSVHCFISTSASLLFLCFPAMPVKGAEKNGVRKVEESRKKDSDTNREGKIGISEFARISCVSISVVADADGKI